ncbi:MAG: nitrogenase component 1, partial [Acutalibacteraceae bacterium]|nr:nitrogenase component 1 [Acutalibacteraceae bacterium]
GNMNCTMRTTQTHYEAATNRALYKGLLPVGDALRKAPPAPVRAVNVIGNYFAIDTSSELIELLGFAGYQVNDLPRVKMYDEYQQMADASLNIYTHPFGKTACEDLKKRLGTPFLEVPYCWNFEEIDRTERAVLEKVATAINASGAGERVGLTPIVRAGLLDPYKYEAEQALAETAKALSGWNITIDAASTPRPFGLAALLESCGFSVTCVYADACGPLDEDAKARWEALASEHGHDAETLPMIDWRMRSERPEDLFEPDMQVLAIGQKAAYYSGTDHFVNLIYQSGLLGFRGVTKLCALMADAAEHEKDTEAVLSEKAIGSAEVVAEGLARTGAVSEESKTQSETTATLSQTNNADRPKEADQASLYAVNYSSDLSGVCSALYELGGLLVMHDASGCNSTYATHDEPRWYGSDSLIFISGLREYDAILGNDEKYISDVVEAAKETDPKFIAVFGSPIAAMTGTDFRGVARVIEKRTGIPTLHFDTSGMHTYQAGMRQAFRALAERFVDEKSAPAKNTDAIKINLLGLTPLDFSIVGNVEALLDWCANNHFDVVSSWAMNANDKSGELRTNALGEPLASLPAIARSAEADINLVLSSTALDAAKVLQERFGTPYVVGLPMGDAACARMADLLKEAALTGVSKTLWETEAADAKGTTGAHALIIGEPVYAASLRWVLEQGASCALTGPVAGPASGVQILCPLEDPCGCLRNTDLQSWREPVIRAALAEADVIYADPLYRNLLPAGSLESTSPKEFHDVPSENYSGRMYRDRIPVFLGPGFKP